MRKLQKVLFLSEKGYKDLKKAVFACTLTNLAMLLPFCVTVMIFSELLTPVANGFIGTYHKHDGRLQQYGILAQQYDSPIDCKWDYSDDYLYSSCFL